MNTLIAPAWVRPYGLAGNVLVAGRDAGVAQNAGHRVSQTVVLWTGVGPQRRRTKTRPQTTSPNASPSMMNMDVYGTGETSWHADNC